MTTVEIPAQTIDIIDGPVSLAEAFSQTDDFGYFSATVRIPTYQFLNAREEYDAFYDMLCEHIVEGAIACSISYTILASEVKEENLIVHISQNMLDMVDVVGAGDLEGIPSDILEGAIARFENRTAA